MSLNQAELDNYLDSIQKAFHVAGEALKVRNDRRILNVREFVDKYLEGRAWLVCELETHCAGRSNQIYAVAFYNFESHIAEMIGSDSEAGINPGEIYRSDQKSMLVGISELVQDPKGFPLSTLICLHLVDEMVMNSGGARTETSWGSDLSGEAINIIGEWKPSLISIARDWMHQSYSDVIQKLLRFPITSPMIALMRLSGSWSD